MKPENLESIYRLSPVQEGILFHTLLEPERGLYLLQLACVLRGRLDPQGLRHAWELVVERNPALRTACHWEEVARPVQVVSRRVPLPWTELDWSGLADAEREERWAELRRTDLERGFDLGRPPLLRLALARTAADEHRLLWTFHHILLDGWCLPLLLEEVFTLYARGAGSPVPEPERRRPYRDYIAWLQRRDPAASAAFWRDSLDGFTAPTPLGIDRPPGRAPATPEDAEHAEQGRDLTAAATAAVAAMARRHGLTLNTLVQGAWALLLSRYAGEPEVVFGATVSGRSAPLPGIEAMVGLFINTLPVRVRVPGTASLVPWLRELQDRHARLLEHEHTPLVEVQEWSDVPRGLPLFESLVAFENYPRHRMHARSFAGLPLDMELERSVDRINYPLALIAFDGDRLALRLNWETGRFDGSAIARALGHLEALLAAMAADPGRRLSDLSPLTGPETHQLLREWNDTAGELPRERALHELFEERAAAAPDAVAVVAGGLSWTYGALDEQADRLADHLLALGLRRGEMVALKLSRGYELVRAPLAVLKAGGVYVPLESGFPEARVRWILGALCVRCLVTDDPRLVDKPGGTDGLPELLHVVHPDGREAGGEAAAPRQRRRAGPDDLAYVIFTSGSTGLPKGVMVRHRPAVNVIDWVNRAFGVGPADRVLFITSLGFDLSVYDVFGLLAAGGSVHVASEEDLAEPGRLVDLLGSEPITFWDSAPAALQQLVPLLPRLPAAGPRRLRLVFLSGDWLPLSLPDEVRETFPGARVIALGGATEATIWSNSFAVEEVDPAWPSIPYGRPIRNARYHVLDEGLLPCPIGVAGDLYIGGACLASGYAGDPVLTAGKFVPDPWSGTPGGVLYRTGDRARHWADGNLQFLGRLDQQVKIRGFRIELGEVEAQLATHPEVREVLAMVREDRPGDRRLVAYVVADRPLGAPALRDYLRQRLPEPMVPGAVVELAALPVTPNGKVDRKALPRPEGPEEDGPAGASAAPRGPVAELLAGIWGELLGRDRIDAESHFFELGGHSLLATQLVSRVRDAFGLTLPMRLLFEAPTVSALAAELEALLRRERGLTAPPLLPAPRDGELPLSFAQERLWFFDRLRPGSALYNMPLALELAGRLDVAALAASLDAVAARHEALRTVFAEGESGRPVQVVRPAAGLELPVVDLAGLPADLRRREAARLAAAEVARPFDLARGPLARAALLCLAADPDSPDSPDGPDGPDSRHTALLTLHHIVADGWSLGVLVREVGELYGALVEGRAPRLPELPVQYADFAVWQRSWLSGEVLAAQLAHWRQRLAGAPPVTALPLDRPRPAVQSYRGARVPFRLPDELGRQLAALTRARGATLFMGLSAIFAALLGRLTGEDDLVVGSPVAARNWRETEGLIGFFVNFLPLRARLADAPGFAALLARVRETTLEAYAHQDLPFERLVEELQPERSLAYAPLFQVQLVLQNAPLGDPELPGLAARPVEADLGSARFDLTLSLAETATGLAGFWEHATDLLDGATVARMAGHFTRLLAAALARPEARLPDLPLLSAGERHQVLAEWAEGPAAPPPATLPDLVAAQARRRPHAVALAGDELSVTYAELELRTLRLARRFAGMGVGPGVPVGLFLRRMPLAVEAILGTLAAGGAYVPLDPGHPAERLAGVIEDAGIAVLVTEEELAASLPTFWGVTVVLDARGEDGDGDGEAPARESAGPFAAAGDTGDNAGPDDLAYVIYTSGSTGRPKGVAVPHRGLAALCAAQARLFGIGPESRVFQFASLGFDASVSEIAVTLAAGGTLVLPPGGELLPGPGLVALLREREITAVTLPPSALAALPREAAAGLPALATLVVAGEACPLELVRHWARSAPHRRLVNGYGLTETTVCAAAAVYTDGDLLPLGRPSDGAGVFLLDRRGHLVPPGVTGELCVSGPVLARGYLGLPDRTAERFIPHPFATSPGERLYRTGDLARHRPDGELELVGRADHQVKVRGVRVEPGEVEAALARCRGVREAAVLVRDDLPGGRGLLAWVVAEDGIDLAAAELRESLRRALPDTLVPARFGFLERLPRTSSGKLDRHALARTAPSDASAGARSGARRTPPRGPAEELLAGIFAEVLAVDEVGTRESFFDLGGHSLLATQVLSRVQAAFGAEVPLALLFEQPTVAGLAAALAERLRGAAEQPPLRPAPRDGAPPLSFAQERLWFLDQLLPGSPLYNVPHAFELQGALSWPALAAALSGVAARHEALRTTFAVPAGGAAPVQVIAPALVLAPPVVDLEGLPAPRGEAEALALAAAEAGRPFDLARGPLVRASLVRLAADRHAALLTLHHVVADGWSVGVLVRELAEFYRAVLEDRRAVLPPLPLQYADFAVWQRRWLSGAKLDAEVAWWSEQLSGAPPELELPFDRPPAGSARSGRGGELPVKLPADLCRALAALGRRCGATLFMVLLAAFQALLARLSGQEDLVVGTPVANRNRLETEGLIGFFVNTLALRGDLGGDPAFGELVARARAVTLAAHGHQDLPFERLVEALRPERSLAGSPLFQVLLALQNAPLEALELPGLTLAPLAVLRRTAKFDLTLSLAETAAGLAGSWEHAADRFDATTVARLAGHFETLLAGAVAQPDARLSALPLLAAAERHQLLAEWNDTARDYPRQSSIDELFELQADRAPGAPAVAFGGEELSYRELDERANRLARHLRRRGVTAGDRVGVCLERSAETVVALLAVLKAGGAYLPLDPDHPRERLAFLLADAGVPVLLTWKRLRDRLPAAGPQVICLDHDADDADGEAIGRESTARLARDDGGTGGESLAYVIYTSGSTGVPKGVAVPHRAVVRLVMETDYIRLGAGDRVAQASTVAFDAATFELWGALLQGAALVGISREALLSPRGLAAELRQRRISTLFLTTALFNQVARKMPSAFATLRHLLFGGEAVDPEPVRQVLLSGPPERLLHVYGPTESTTFASWHRVREVPAGAWTLPIGRPIANTRMYVLDPHLRPVPAGVTGELCIGGDGLAVEYLGRPELTRERFAASPALPGERLYRTGDRVRRLPDGTLEFLGRADHQIKLRGFRIELGEVEAALAGHAGVREAVVVVRQEPEGDRSLMACVVPAGGGSPELLAAALRESLRHRLPAPMVPSHFVFVDALPLTPSGKIDRRALERLEPERAAGSSLVPRGPVEELLAALFASLLGVERVGVEESFFELGGHSLLATRLVSRVREAFGVELPIAALFEEPAVAGLAGRIEQAVRQGERVPSIAPAPRDGVLPLSFSQERLWFLHRFDPGSAAYNMPLAARLAGPLDSRALESALAEIVRRHEVLRTVYVEGEAGTAGQVVLPAGLSVLPRVDLRGLPAAARRLEARRLSAEEARRPFDLARGPVLRAALLALDGGEHLLLLTLHHIAGDGWSLGVFGRELEALYGAYSAGRAADLPPLPVQYADFAIWQRRRLTGAVLAERLESWRQRLAGAPPLLELPTERPRPEAQRFRGASRTVSLPAGLVAGLRRLAGRSGATLFMVLLAASKALFHRYTGQEDVVLGAPIAGRTRGETERLVGCFLNTLALRTRLAGDPPFEELLARVREVTLAAYTHQDLPFELLLEELRPERSLAHTPLFQVMLNGLEPETGGAGLGGALRLPGLVVEPETPAGPVARFDLEIYMAESAGSLTLELVHDRDLFGEAQIARLAEHLESLLTAVVAEPGRRLSAIELAPAARAAATLAAPLTESVAGRFGRIAAAHPERPAVSMDGEARTYAELEQAANRVAGALLALSGRPGERIALLFTPGMPLVAAILGTLLAGKTYVPLDPCDPVRRWREVLEDSGASALLTAQSGREAAAGLAAARPGGPLPVLDVEALPAMPPDRACPPAPAEALAYLLYTSGSTGRPKAVMQSQRNAAGYAVVYGRRLGLTPADRLTFLSSYTFDAAVMDLFGALLHGAELCLWDTRERGVAGLARWLDEREITVYHSTPALFRALLAGREGEERFPSLRRVVLGGEEVRRDDAERCAEAFPAARLVNGLGPTESTLALQHVVEEEDGTARPSVPVGQPVDGMAMTLRCGWGEQAALWGLGEIELRGPWLAPGYWRRPDLTAASFVPDPAGDGGRAYRTGDLGRLLPGGAVEFAGRRDLQVKVRGVRIEPGEVEAVLLAHPGVREAAVVARRDGDGEVRLVACLVPRGEAPAGLVHELRGFLAERLAPAAVPAAFILLAALPTTATGKVDRRALAALPDHGGETAGGGEPPRGWAEETLAALWAEVLQRDRIGRHDDFFALGGHSLLAMQLVSRVRQAFALELPLRRLFEAPTVAALAATLGAAGRTAGGAVDGANIADIADIADIAPPLAPRSGRGAPPLSFAQERLWFLDQLVPGSPLYNMPMALGLRGRLDRPALAAGLAAVVARHEALRTTFAAPEGTARPAQIVAQIIAGIAVLPLPLVDLAGLPEARRDGEARVLACREAGRPFDLARGPLLRTTLLRLGEERHVALLTLHHIVADGWSLGVLVREAGELYAAGVEGRPPRLPELSVQYADFAVWQRGWLTGEVLAEQIAYWRGRLAGAPLVIDLPFDRPRAALGAPSFRGAHLPVYLPAGLSQRLAGLARARGATLFITLLAAFQAFLARVSRQTDLVVGSPVAGRNRVETERLIGFFVNFLPLRGELGDDPGFGTLLARARETALSAYAHQDLPFERLVEELQPERSLAHTPVFQAQLVLQNAPMAALELPGLVLEPVDAAPGSARFELTLSLAETAGGLAGYWEYSTELFDVASAARLAGCFETLLAAAVAAPESRVSDLPLLGAAERHQLLVEWNDAAGALPAAPAGLLHRRAAAQAELRPDAVAAVCGDACLSYGELSRRSRRLAGHLAGLGVGPGVLVGLFVERSLEMLVGVLGVLEAGGAWLPLDPGYPMERLAAMLEDSGVAVLLTQESLSGALPTFWGFTVHLDGADELSQAGEETGLPGLPGLPDIAPEELAYVIYTSGSTGRPKGVALSHAGLANLCAAQERLFGLGADARVLQFSSLSFDASVWELAMALAAGATLVLAPRRELLPGPDLMALLRDRAVTAVTLPPSALAALPASGSAELPHLATLVVAGEACPPELARQWSGGRRFWNAYGPTETTVCATAARDDGGGRVPVGRPIHNAAACLLDAWGNPAPLGVPGELYVGGPGLARGYLGLPERTAERFVPHPFASTPGERLYRTGDLMRLLPSGDLEFLGRADHQVKVRGCRVELGEVEAALARCRGVREAVVVVSDGLPGGRGLAAYVVPEEGSRIDGGELRAHLRSRLPDYMVPSHVVPAASLPLTPNGKVDRKALAARGAAAVPAPRAAAPPRNAVEEVLAGIWRAVLGAPDLGVHDNFFDSGGHSLNAVQVVTRVREVFDVELQLQHLFQLPTVAELAAAVLDRPELRDKVEQIAEIRVRLAGMSEEEVEALLLSDLPGLAELGPSPENEIV